MRIVDRPAEIAGYKSIGVSPGRAYVQVGLINPSVAFDKMLKELYKQRN
jgi:hypothetical protein